MRALVVDADWDPRPDAELSAEERRGRWVRDARLAWRHPRWELSERPDPVVSAPDEVLVRTRTVGIAVSTLRMIETDAEGYVVLPYRMRLPLVPGHEVAGEVVEVGPAVRSVRPGDPVAIETLRPCQRCAPCRRGLVNQCVQSRFSGFDVDGGMAEYIAVPQRHARPLAGLTARFGVRATYEIGALCEPAAVAYVGMFVRAGGFLPGATVAVFGCGPIGLAAVALARCAGAATVIAFDREPQRCAVARQLGADHVVDVAELELAGSSAGAAVLAHTGGAGADMAVEASSAGARVVPEIERSLAIGGKVVLLGVGAQPVPTRPAAYLSRGAGMHAMMGHLGGFDPVIELHAAGRLDLRPIITARYALADGIEAMRRAGRRQEAKILLLPTGAEA